MPPERALVLLTQVKDAERIMVRGGGLGLCDDGLLAMLVTVPIMLWLMVSVVVCARRAASFFLPSAAAFIGS